MFDRIGETFRWIKTRGTKSAIARAAPTNARPSEVAPETVTPREPLCRIEASTPQENGVNSPAVAAIRFEIRLTRSTETTRPSAIRISPDLANRLRTEIVPPHSRVFRIEAVPIFSTPTAIVAIRPRKAFGAAVLRRRISTDPLQGNIKTEVSNGLPHGPRVVMRLAA